MDQTELELGVMATALKMEFERAFLDWTKREGTRSVPAVIYRACINDLDRMISTHATSLPPLFPRGSAQPG